MPSNLLSNSTSPYLLQHQHNPVHWVEWSSETLAFAIEQNKPLIVSIGYSACHWCHVMEHECFENEALASQMNQFFVCIKVDREERPDIDQIYMDAIQNMGIRGGWPLNVFCMPDGKPFYGGTYFPATQWQNILTQISNAFSNHYDEMLKSAEQFKASLNRTESEKYGLKTSTEKITLSELENSVKNFSESFDTLYGGLDRAPKFPMPCVYQFLFSYWKLTGDPNALSHTIFTLTKIAEGGIYDQIGGGFARYSTDSQWFLPHFEKMLYDNAQLISLYAIAYKITQNELFKTVVYETIAFVDSELSSENGGFFAALDADSEGEEGKFYVWKKNEINEILGKESSDFCTYFNITKEGNWEHGLNIPYVTKSENISKLFFWKKQLLAARNKRIKPGLDYKIITSWHALHINALVDAYRAFKQQSFLDKALKAAFFIEKNLKTNDSQLFHTHKEKGNPILGFLEDYAYVIQAYINLYEATFDLKWLDLAKQYLGYTLSHFDDSTDCFLYFTEINAEKLVARKKEIFDNVMPSSNAVMAINMYKLGHFYAEPALVSKAEIMLKNMKKLICTDINYTANWGILACMDLASIKQIVVSGNQSQDAVNQLEKIYLPFHILAKTNDIESLPIFKNRHTEQPLKVYVCENNSCQKPYENLDEWKNYLYK